MNPVKARVLALLAVFLGAIRLYAAITGSISGIGSDPSGALILGVTVVATSASTNIQHTTVTDSKGSYHGTFATDKGSQRVETIGNAPEGHDRHATTRGKESPISAHKRLQKVAEVSTGIMRMFQPELTDQIGQVIPTTSAPCVCPPLFVIFESERLGSVTI